MHIFLYISQSVIIYNSFKLIYSISVEKIVYIRFPFTAFHRKIKHKISIKLTILSYFSHLNVDCKTPLTGV